MIHFALPVATDCHRGTRLVRMIFDQDPIRQWQIHDHANQYSSVTPYPTVKRRSNDQEGQVSESEPGL